MIQTHLKPAIGSVRLSKLTAQHLDSVYASVNHSPASIRKIHQVASGALKQAVRWKLVARNVAEEATPPSLGARNINPPEPHVLRQLLDALPVDFSHMLQLAATTGMRRGELCAIRWRDIDFDKCSLSISKSVIVVRGGTAEKPTKTGTTRVITLDPTTLRTLVAARRMASERALVVESRSNPMATYSRPMREIHARIDRIRLRGDSSGGRTGSH